jgi:hypothetical protein
MHNLNPVVDPQLESARFQPLSLKRDIPVSKFAFSNGSTCVPLRRGSLRSWTACGAQGGALYNLNPVRPIA